MSRLDNYTSYVQAAMDSWHCPGVALSVIRGQTLLHQTVLGWQDVARQLPLTADTRFAMASVTKSFTAMSAALLVDDGKLAWDKPVREYLPEFILHDGYATQHVTVRDMLSHRTGLPRHDFSAWRVPLTRAEYVARMRHLKFSASFREKFQYNNLMYYATAHLVETLAGQPWEAFVQARLFDPLGMSASNFTPEPPLPGQANALGYRVERNADGAFRTLVKTDFGAHTALSPGAAGALFSTLADLTQWLRVHVNAGQVGDTRLVSADNLKQMHLPHTIIPGGGFNQALLGNTIFTYGLGWFIEPYRGLTLIHHGGNVEGHSLIIGFVPEEQLGIVALTNVALLPLRDVLLYESIDRALDLPDRDWNTRFHTMFDPLLVAQAKSKQTSAEERVPEAPPSHALADYAGEYQAEGYPDFAVRLEGDGLQAQIVGSLPWTLLHHQHFDLFEWSLPDIDERMKVRFLLDDQGRVARVAVPLEPAVDDIVFTRKPPTLVPDLLAALVGEYPLPIEGLTLTVTVRDGQVYAAQTGNPPERLDAYRLTPDTVGFTLKRTRFDFMRHGHTVTGVAIKMPTMTIEAPRRP